VIQRVERDRVDVKLGAWHDVDRESTLEIGLVQGLPEADKMDWIIQKAAELGAAWIQPVVCDRSVVRLSGERAARREAHWRRVAVAACEQCGRNRIPDVRPTLGFQSWIAVPSSTNPQQVGDLRRRWMLVPDGTPVAAMAPPAGPIELLVEPEGGLSDRELELAGRASEPVALGRRVLRVETAPLVAIAAMHALWGDFA
jgi:16S rRNA (uracil1498-N3)-methyltransferase